MQLIADILSFQDNSTSLREQLQSAETDWDNLVKIGSEHLMLPALFSRLHSKSLLDNLPAELKTYLEELYHINKNRNQELCKEAQAISILLDENRIDYVFIKGISIVADSSVDIGERMIGDIDILVASAHIHKAFELLKKNGYNQLVEFNYEVKGFRHLPRQISKEKIGAIELHASILNKKSDILDPNDILKSKINSNGIPIPSREFQLWITILSAQCNDHFSFLRPLNFKSIYDCLCMGLPSNLSMMEAISNHTHGRRFLASASIFFKELLPKSETFDSKCHKKMLSFSYGKPSFGHMLHRLSSQVFYVSSRIPLILRNSSYRKHILKHKIFAKKS